MLKDLFPRYPASKLKDDFQSLHNEMVASARVVKKAHEIDENYVIGCMIAGGPSKYPLTCDPKDVLKNQQCIQEGIYYTADVMLRGEYPYFAQRIWEKYNLDLDITEQDKIDFKNGTADMITYSYYACLLYTSPSPRD